MTAVLVTRPTDEAKALVRALQAKAFHVHAVPTIELVPVSANSAAGRQIRRTFWALRPSDWVVVTSRFGAATAAQHLLLADGLSYSPVRWAAIGGAAARGLVNAGITPDVTTSAYRPSGLASAMAADGRLSGRRVLLARSDAADPWLPQAIVAAGALVHDVVTYQTVEGTSWGRSALHDAASDPTLGAIVVASGSAARGLVRMIQGESRPLRIATASPLERLRAIPTITIGAATTSAAASAGLHVTAEADEPTVAGLVRAVIAAISALDPDPIAQSGGSRR